VAIAAWVFAAAAQAQAPAQSPGERVVARVFGAQVTAAELRWIEGKPAAEAVAPLRQRVLAAATERFMAANSLYATEEDYAAFGKFDAEFRRAEIARRKEQKAGLEQELKRADLDAKQRQAYEQQLGVLASLEKHDAERAAMPMGDAARRSVWGPWIANYKVNKALYDKYGGRVGITKWGPEPTGAIEALLREHEKKGDFAILDPALAKAFWDWHATQPRMPMRPEQVDFGYYWLKPVKGSEGAKERRGEGEKE
jgi:hypothetical protein